MDGALEEVIDGALVEVLDGALVEEIVGALVKEIDGALVEVMDGALVEVMDGALVKVIDGALVEVIVGAGLGAAKRVLVGAAVGEVVLVVVGEAVLTVVVGIVIIGDILGAMVELLDDVFVLMTTLPALIADVRKASKLIEPNPVDESHPIAGKKPSLQHLLYILPLDLTFNWLQPFLVPPVMSLVNCA